MAFALASAGALGAMETIELEQVNVVAHAHHPLTVEINPRAPAQPIPAQDGADILRSIPGFNVIRKGGTDGDPVLRGFAGSRLGILVDGENILGGCGNRMDPPTAYVFPLAYDRVVVVKGPQSVVHGPGYSAGVVLFERVTRQLAEPKASLQGSIAAGSFGRNDQFGEALAGTPAFQARVVGTRTAADDYEDGDGRKVHSQYERWSTHGSVAWTPDKATLIEVSGIRSDGEAAYADRGMDGVKFARSNIGIRARLAPAADSLKSVEFQAFYNDVDHVMDNFTLRTFVPSGMMPNPAVSNPDRRTFGIRAVADLRPAEPVGLLAGIEHQGNRHTVRSTRNELTTPYRSLARTRDATFVMTGVFSEVTGKVTEHQRWVAGARADFWSATDHRHQIAVSMNMMPNPTAGQRREAVLPSGFVRYEVDLTAETRAYAGIGHARRFPDYWELFNKESATSLSAFGTSPERTTQVDLGLVHRTGPVRLSATAFAARISDFILIQGAYPKPSGMGGTRAATISRNVDAESIGGEAAVGWVPGNGWRADASVAWVRAENRTDRLPLAQQPPLEGRLGLAYTGRGWSAGALTRLVARQDRFALNQGNIVGQDLGPTSGFAVVSLHAAWKPRDFVQVTVGVDNLFDRTYAEHLSRGGAMVAGFPAPTVRVNEPGRTVWMVAQLTF